MTLRYDAYSTEADYKEALFLTIVGLEEKGKIELEPYSDNVRGGYATIGVGFKIDSNWVDILTVFGFNISAPKGTPEWTYIQNLKRIVGNGQKFTKAGMSLLLKKLDAIMTKRANDPAVTSAIPGMDKPTAFAFNDLDQVEAAFQVIAGKRDDILEKWLGETTKYSIVPQSNERISLLSLVYNNVIGFKDEAQKTAKSESLLKAIKAGNRAEAWFEIRYRSNKAGSGHEKGTAIRRFYEADLFGLYNPGESTTEEKILEYKTVMRMYTFNRTKIDEYERAWGKYVSTANTEYYVDWVKGLQDNLQPARDFLVTTYSRGMAIDGEIIVGAGLDTYLYKEGTDASDKGRKELKGTAKGDLIFGEKGDDVIKGNAGNDVIYGGAGDDSITGGKGDDYLIGGEGYDIYYYSPGDGYDWIYDEDNKGKIVVLKPDALALEKMAVGTLYKQGDANIWKSANGVIEITHNSPWQVVFEDGGTITLGDDFQSGDFGINLIDTPDDPETALTIAGDLAPVDFDPNTPGVQIQGRQ